MNLKGIAWLSSRTQRFEQQRRFAAEILGLEPYYEEEHLALFRLPNGDTFEVTGPRSRVWDTPTLDSHPDGRGPAPIAAFEVDDIDDARSELEGKGIEFIGPMHGDESTGNRWTYFTSPDGYVYELCQLAAGT